jgi:hypothetical protein
MTYCAICYRPALPVLVVGRHLGEAEEIAGFLVERYDAEFVRHVSVEELSWPNIVGDDFCAELSYRSPSTTSRPVFVLAKDGPGSATVITEFQRRGWPIIGTATLPGHPTSKTWWTSPPPLPGHFHVVRCDELRSLAFTYGSGEYGRALSFPPKKPVWWSRFRRRLPGAIEHAGARAREGVTGPRRWADIESSWVYRPDEAEFYIRINSAREPSPTPPPAA